MLIPMVLNQVNNMTVDFYKYDMDISLLFSGENCVKEKEKSLAQTKLSKQNTNHAPVLLFSSVIKTNKES